MVSFTVYLKYLSFIIQSCLRMTSQSFEEWKIIHTQYVEKITELFELKKNY